MSVLKSVVSLNPRGEYAFRAPADLAERFHRLQRRIEREHAARHEAERLLETKSLELFAANQRLVELNAELEERVKARTQQVEDARKEAVVVGRTDHLTGIANRLEYSEHLERSLDDATRRRRAVGVLLVDLDGFKLVNDTYGHRHGDQLLIALASRLQGMVRQEDLVARIGGDEFAVVIEGHDAKSITSIACRFRGIFEQSMTIHGVTIRPRGSLGLAIFPDHCDGPADLQRFADLALYQSKKRGEGQIVVFEPVLLQAYEYRQRMEAEFRTALDGGRIDLFYQPIMNLASGAIEAIEALARWTDSKGAEISPAYFIPMAEQCGIIRGVGRTLLEKALLEAKAWLTEGFIERISFNVSPLEILDRGFSNAVIDTLARVGVNPRHLLLEITEGSALESLTVVERVMSSLRAHGVRFALDDFGCGYSDLTTLRKLPISVLKIDRSLLMDSETDVAARIILKNVVALCHELRIRPICEGAETPEQLRFLRYINCASVQGFVSGRPVSAAAMDSIFRSPNREEATNLGSPVR